MAENHTGVRRRFRKKMPESERKRRKAERDKFFIQSRICLGSELARWKAVKAENGLKSDREVATFLIDSYRHRSIQAATVAGTSKATFTPLPTEPWDARTLSSSHVLGKDLSNNRSDDVWKQSGVVAFEEEEFRVEIADDGTVKEEDLSDTDEVTSVSGIMAVEAEDQSHTGEVREGVSVIKAELAEDQLDTDEVTECVSIIKAENECDSLCSDIKCIVFLPQLKQLARMNISACKTCNSREVELVDEYVGSALYLKWVCKGGHVSGRWCSQPLLNKGMHSGDFLICSTILTSGNNYSKIGFWASMLHLKFPSAFQFSEFQEHIWSPP